MQKNSVNKVIIVGNLGQDPEARFTPQGTAVTNLSVATNESWKNQSGEIQDRTEWHRVVIFNEALGNIAEQYLRKGSTVYIEGQLQTRKWGEPGQEKYTTEVVLQRYRGELTMLGNRQDQGSAGNYIPQDTGFDGGSSQNMVENSNDAGSKFEDLDDEIPF